MPREHASTPFVILIACAAALGGFLFGYDTACINGAVVALRSHFEVGPVLVGFSVSLALLGSAAGAFLAGRSPTGTGGSRPCWWRPSCLPSARSAPGSRSPSGISLCGGSSAASAWASPAR
jgi:hypothetical protein